MPRQFKSIMELTAEDWRRALDLRPDETPRAVIVEGSWWRAQRTQWRLSYLTDVRELPFPEMFVGKWRGKPVAYSCAYGAPRAVEVVHLFASLGATLAIQIGTCGVMRNGLRTGDVVLPIRAWCEEGVAQHYGAGPFAEATLGWVATAQGLLQAHGLTSHLAQHVTCAALFPQSGRMVERWHEAGYESVDMGSAATMAAAAHFGTAALAMLVVWDDLLSGKSFLDPLTESEATALEAGNRVVYETALALVEAI